ncbi:fasciclin domain-containing protein [Leptolyngbya sp. NIES-2104]|uniref:fasciclin domain-containing protein n=1 Tax=Leptolyngbya sp. NIES-2104 TaxID=1552121 RepID=UPI0006ECC373|nr:fasciclin domain-containing protein [Leptolyngbya sp. NIES-2104]GAP95817.1 sensory subunit of low CO2-induced protein complex, putative [Leptolyngbya sp. NIES-2104]
MANLLQTASEAGSFKTLLSAIDKAGIGAELENADGTFTLLAPTDEAFSKLPEDTLNALLADLPKLRRVLSYHVLDGDVRFEDLTEIFEAPTLEGSVIAVDHEGGIKVNDIAVTKADILADNGVIHAIDGVLMPAILAGS